MSHGSRRTPDSLLEAATSAFAFILGCALIASSPAPAAWGIVGWILAMGGMTGLAIVLSRR